MVITTVLAQYRPVFISLANCKVHTLANQPCYRCQLYTWTSGWQKSPVAPLSSYASLYKLAMSPKTPVLCRVFPKEACLESCRGGSVNREPPSSKRRPYRDSLIQLPQPRATSQKTVVSTQDFPKSQSWHKYIVVRFISEVGLHPTLRLYLGYLTDPVLKCRAYGAACVCSNS